ncbi:MAG: hypothetical protein ACLP0J_25325 [Solirubrobacteraceae bacterium]|jgi:hypothetical protein
MELRAHVLPVGPPVEPRYQIGREGAIVLLADELAEHEHTVIAGARRIGKSTVALGALERLADDGVVVCAIDCRLMPTAADLALELDAQRLANAPELSQQARRAGGFALRLWRTLLASEDRPSGDERFAEAVAEQLAQGRGSPTVAEALAAVAHAGHDRGAVIFLDEAEALHAQPEAADALRAVMRARSRTLTLVFAGSEPSLMETLFADGGLLETNAQPFALEPVIAPHAWMEGLRTHMREYLGVTIDRGAVDILLDASGGHPYRTMLAANRTHALARELVQTHIDEALAATALARVRRDRRWSLP